MSIEKIVYFVRHGQSEDNVAPVFQSPDSPLNAKGRSQAEKIAERVSGLSFETFIASPFPRAKETAQFIAKATKKEPEYAELFIERVKLSNLAGKSYEDASANVLWRTWEKSLHTSGMHVEDGENFDDLMLRADQALAFLTSRKEKSLVVVTHGYFLRTIVARVLMGELLTGEAFARFHHRAQMENTGLTVLRYHGAFEEDPCWRLWVYNDHAHLG